MWIEINFMSLIINKLWDIMSNQAQRSNQEHKAFLAPGNHVVNIANGSLTKALGLIKFFYTFQVVNFIIEQEGEKKSKTLS